MKWQEWNCVKNGTKKATKNMRNELCSSYNVENGNVYIYQSAFASPYAFEAVKSDGNSPNNLKEFTLLSILALTCNIYAKTSITVFLLLLLCRFFILFSLFFSSVDRECDTESERAWVWNVNVDVAQCIKSEHHEQSQQKINRENGMWNIADKRNNRLMILGVTIERVPHRLRSQWVCKW